MESVDSTSHNPTQIDSWLKQQPQPSILASHNSTFNNNTINNNHKTLSISSTSSSITMHERNIMSTNNSHWNGYHQRSSLVPSPTLSISSISSSSGPSLSLPRKSSTIGINGQLLPLPDLEPLMIHPKDKEDEEDDTQQSDNTSSESLTVMSNEDKQQRIGFLENQLVRVQHEAQSYKEQLKYHDQTAQRILEVSLAEKEKQNVEIRQLVDVIGKQEQLIHLLQQKLSFTSSTDITTTDTLPPLSQECPRHTNAEFETMRLQMMGMRKELDTLISEKRSLETRMAAFLEDELDDIAMSHEDLGTFGYHNNSDQQHQEILQHLEMRRRSSSLLDADQYSLMAFGTTPTTSNIQVNASNSSVLLPPLNQVNEEEDDDDYDDAVSRYSSFASSSMTATTSFNSHSISSPISLSNRQSVIISSSSNTMNSPTTAANNNAARKAAWSRVMIPTERSMQLPPATPPPSHPLPPVPPINTLEAAAVSAAAKEDYNSLEYTPPSPATTATSRSTRSFSPSHRMSMHPLVISTALSNQSKHISADAITQGQHPARSISPSLPSAPPTTASPQSSSLLAALNKNHSVDANIERSIVTGNDRTSTDSGMTADKRGFWKGMKKKWMK